MNYKARILVKCHILPVAINNWSSDSEMAAPGGPAQETEQAMDNCAQNRRPLMHMTGSLFNSFIIWKIVKKPFVELASIVIEE